MAAVDKNNLPTNIDQVLGKGRNDFHEADNIRLPFVGQYIIIPPRVYILSVVGCLGHNYGHGCNY